MLLRVVEMSRTYGAKKGLDRTEGRRDRADVLREGIVSDILGGRIGERTAVARNSSRDLGGVALKRVAKSQ